MAELKPFEVIMRIDYAASKGPEVVAHAERVQELVRCRDCKHRDPEDKGCDCAGHEMVMGGIIPMPDNWFCADGERRTHDRSQDISL